MKTNIEFSKGEYGFGTNWTLVINQKRFYLGQDVKFCTRVLGLRPSAITEILGTNDFSTEKNRIKLANFIRKELGINSKNYQNFETWKFCGN